MGKSGQPLIHSQTRKAFDTTAVKALGEEETTQGMGQN